MRYERNVQSRANRGLPPMGRDAWDRSAEGLRSNQERGGEQETRAREGLSELIQRSLANNNQGEDVVQVTVRDPDSGEDITTRPDSIGRNEDGDIDIVHDHKDKSGEDKVIYNCEQMRAQKIMLRDPETGQPTGRHIVTVSSAHPRLDEPSPLPRPSRPLARDSEIYFTDANGRPTHQWIIDDRAPGGGFWEPLGG